MRSSHTDFHAKGGVAGARPRFYKVHGDPKAIELAASWLQQAERPAVLAGSQVQFCRGAALGYGLVESCQPEEEV